MLFRSAYKLIGYPLPRDYSYAGAIDMSRQIRSILCDDICQRVQTIGGSADKLPFPGTLLLNQAVTVKVLICKGWVRSNRITIWQLLLRKQPAADVVIIARLSPPARSILDYFVIPAFSQLSGTLNAREKDNDAFLELYRFDDLQPFIDSFRRYSLRGAA